MTASGLWVHSDRWKQQQSLAKFRTTLPSNLYLTMVHAQHSPQSHLDCTPLRWSYCGITGDQRLKLGHVSLLPLAGLPVIKDIWGWRDLWIWGSHGSLASASPVVLSSVQGTSCHVRACCPPCRPPGANNSILHSHFQFGKGKWPDLWARRWLGKSQVIKTAWQNKDTGFELKKRHWGHLNAKCSQGSLPVTWPLLVRLVSLKWAGEPCELVARPGTPSSRNTVSCWQDQETSTVWPLLPIWDDPFFIS